MIAPGTERPSRRPVSRALPAAWGLALLLASCQGPLPMTAQVAPPARVAGPQRILVIAARFPGTAPTRTLAQLRDKIDKVNYQLRSASYGKAWLEARLTGWHEMPDPLSAYRVSPYNFQVDRERVRKLVADAVGAAARKESLARFDLVWIAAGAFTRPGEGYGMIAYCANPGMLTGVRRGKARLETVALPGGGAFSGPAVVSAENAHVGHVFHDLLHALGGVRDGMRVVPDLYDYDLQSNPPGGRMLPGLFSIHAGPWDIMSQHFIDRNMAPPPPSSFTRLQLGWIEPDQIVTVRPGEHRELSLEPLARGRGRLVVRIPIDARRYLLLENRQRIDGDRILPASGLLVLEVDTSREEGSSIVHVANANPGVSGFRAAPFAPGRGERRAYVNRSAGVAVLPLAAEPGGAIRLRVTTPDRIRRQPSG